MTQAMTFPCDLCAESGGIEIEPGIITCGGCGFVYVPERRSAHEIANAWSDIYRNDSYDPQWNGVKARLFYAAHNLNSVTGLRGKTLLDIGAGTGDFMRYAEALGAKTTGLEPYAGNRQHDLSYFTGDTTSAPWGIEQMKFDAVTINWTLENSGDCIQMLNWARERLAPDGVVQVATGSRILVPYKKPYSAYFGKLAPDLHCFRWSYNSLEHAMQQAGLRVVNVNDFEQRDELVMVAEDGEAPDVPHDDPKKVAEYFREWKRQFP